MAKLRMSHDPRMIKNDHLDWASVAAMLFVYASAKAFLSFPSRMAKAAHTASWTVPLASVLISVVWLAPLVYVLSKNPEEDIIGITRRLAGKPLAFVLGALAYAHNIGLVATCAREIGEALATVVLPLTPLTFTTASLFATGTYVALKGTEVVARLSLVAAVAVTFYVSMLSVLSMPGWCRDALVPVLGPGIPQLLKTYVVRQAIYGEVFAVGMLAPYLRKKKDLGKAVAVGAGATAALLSLTVIACEMMFPYPSLSQIPVPFLRVIRLIRLSRFFQRFDAFFVMLWLGVGSLSIAVGSCAASHIIGSLSPLKSYRAAALITGALGFAASAFIGSFSRAIILDFDVIRPYSVILLMGWPFMLFILHFAKSGTKLKPEAGSHDQAGG